MVSQLWIGEYNPFFMTVGYLMLLAMFINTLTGPAYFSNLGTGNVYSNSVAQLIIGMCNLVLGLLFGGYGAGVGVVVVYAVALTVGSLYLMIKFLLSEGRPLALLLPAEKRRYAAFCGLTVVLSSVVSANLQAVGGGAKYVAVMLPFFVLITVSTKIEPLRSFGARVLRRGSHS